jgi:geranylgeranyl pyrophosphate synthase
MVAQNTDSPARVEELGAHFESLLRRYVETASTDPVPNLHDAMAYALGTDVADPLQRGKRIRPVLCLLSAEALDAPLERAEPFALAIELMHNFCLVHDDIEDGDTMRRGREAVWVKYGLAHGINVGDFLLVHTQKVLAESAQPGLSDATRIRLMQLLSHTLERTHIGQSLDISARADRDLTVERYMELVREKTGFYLAAPIQGGAIAAGAGEDVIATIGEMAALLGPLFQIADDIIDLTHGKGREAIGSDIREGKRSFLVAHTAVACTAEAGTETGEASAADRETLFDILDRSREETSEADIDWVTALFEKHGAVEAGRDRCRRLYAQSQARLEKLPEPLARALGPVFESLTERIR